MTLRGTLLNYLKGIINDDELHLIKLLLDKANLSAKLKGQKRNIFITNIGSLQGDGASALLFIINLAISLLIFLIESKDSNNNNTQYDHNYNKPHKDNDVPIPEHLKNHNYYIPVDTYFTLDRLYADHIGLTLTSLRIYILKGIEEQGPKVYNTEIYLPTN